MVSVLVAMDLLRNYYEKYVIVKKNSTSFSSVQQSCLGPMCFSFNMFPQREHTVISVFVTDDTQLYNNQLMCK